MKQKRKIENEHVFAMLWYPKNQRAFNLVLPLCSFLLRDLAKNGDLLLTFPARPQRTFLYRERANVYCMGAAERSALLLGMKEHT